MIAIAVKLSAAGIRDCWNDADLWLRNLGVEGQLTPEKVAFFNTYVEYKPGYNPDPEQFSYDRPLERNIGAYAGWMKPNDWFDPYGGSLVMQCCTGNMTRALYYAWKAAAIYKDGKLSVNLLMNLDTPDVEVVSCIPYSGRVEIRPKKGGELRLRLPDWAKFETAAAAVNGKAVTLKADGAYAVISAVSAGDEIILELELTETTASIIVEKHKYKIWLRGNDVVDIKPRGDICPLFTKSRYASGEVLYKKVTRFVTDEDINW